MRRPLRLVSWNANGLLPRRTELIQFLGEYDVDIALLQETHLRPERAFTLPNYAVYRADRPVQDPRASSGGTAVAVHRRLPHRRIDHQGWRTEVTTVAVDIAGTEVSITSLYKPPGARLCPAELDQLLRPTEAALVAGDFNSKEVAWGCRQTSNSGRALRRYLDARPHIDLAVPDGPTHYPAQARYAADILDIALHCNLPAALTVSVVSDLSSDHLPVFCLLEDPSTFRLPPSRRPRVNWRKYFNHLADRPLDPPPPASTPAALDGQVVDLQEKLRDAVAAAVIPAANDHRRRLPDHLMEEVKTRRRLRRTWQETRCPRARAAFQRQADKVKTLLQDHSEGKWRDFLSSLATEDGSLWRLSKILRREKPTQHPLRGGQGMAYTAEDRAETFAEEMEKQFSPHADVQDVQHTEAVTAYVDAIQPGVDEEDDDPLQPVTEEEVTSLLATLKRKKAPGPDCLGAPALRKLPPWVIGWLVNIYASCLRLRHFPSPWKTAKVILLPKPHKDRTRPDSYRPISLLCTLSKVLEKLILARVPEEFHQSVRTEQFGFRRGHSTELQLTRVVTSLVDAANKKEVTTSVFIDVSKAFDKVWHEGLLYKLAHSPLPRSLWWILKSYLQDRTFAVSIGPVTSPPRPVTAGVPQGSVLGPLLYLWYTNDIPVAPRVTLSLYADDAAFSAHSIRIRQSAAYIQRQLDLLAPWLQKWRVKVNPTKCEAICFTRKHYGTVQRQRLTLQGEAVPWVNKVKYLGVTLDRRLTSSQHVKHRLAMVKAATWKMSPLLRHSSPLSSKTKMLLYTQIARPALLYAAPAWFQLLAPSWKKKLQIFQNRCLRQATKSPWFVRNSVIARSSGIPSVEDFVRERARAMHSRAADSEWQHLRLLATNPGPPEDVYKRPRALLDDPP